MYLFFQRYLVRAIVAGAVSSHGRTNSYLRDVSKTYPGGHRAVKEHEPRDRRRRARGAGRAVGLREDDRARG